MTNTDETELIDTYQEFYRNYYQNEIQELAQDYPNKQPSLYIDWEYLHQFDPQLAEDFRNNPEQLREYAEKALRLYDLPTDVSLEQARVRMQALPEHTEINDIRATHREMLITVPGTVKKITDIRPKITTAAFECRHCGTLARIPQEDRDLTEPSECQDCEGQGPFHLNYDNSEFTDAQRLALQSSTTGCKAGESKTLEVQLEHDITGDASIGDEVVVTGILKLTQKQHSSHPSNLFEMYLRGMSVEVQEDDVGTLEVTDEDKKEITELSNESNLYERLEQSIAPTVYGHKMEKRGLVFQLFSGVSKDQEDGTAVRGNIHTLFVTDPGTLFERAIERAAKCSPHAVAVDTRKTPATGLTTTSIKSSSSSKEEGWTLGAGPLLEADQGHAIIKGISDLNAEAQTSLETVLKRQAVTASTATTPETFDARTSVIAIETPTNGRFDPYKPIGEQIDLRPDLLSSFDLVFPITDQPDATEDASQAEHTFTTAHSEPLSHSDSTDDKDGRGSETVAPEIDLDLLRKYITYARRVCHPLLTKEAETELREYYINVRSQKIDEHTPALVPENTLEMLIRLGEASARARLSETVEKADAQRAIELFQYSLEQCGIAAQPGKLNAEVITHTESQGEATIREAVKAVIQDLEEDFGEDVPLGAIFKRAEDKGIEQNAAEYGLELLKQNGDVYEPNRSNHFKTT